jgi:hypothetical protein
MISKGSRRSQKVVEDSRGCQNVLEGSRGSVFSIKFSNWVDI